MTFLAYQFALDPTPAQERALRSHAGAARVAFNWGLARVKANLGAAGSGEVLRDHRGRPYAAARVVAQLAAQGLERRQGRGRPVVGASAPRRRSTPGSTSWRGH